MTGGAQVGTSVETRDLLVISPLNDFDCAACGGSDELLKMEDAGPLCMPCADLDHLVFLPRGDAALSRRAKKASALWAVVVRYSRARKRYERQGLLVEPDALAEAEQECLADADVRARRRERDEQRRAQADDTFVERLTAQILERYPGCPPDRAASIAMHTALRGSGRVGRSAAARAGQADAVDLAVAASVRHRDTNYDALLMAGVDRAAARARIRGDVDAVLARWRGAR
jgi:hypothetical protein